MTKPAYSENSGFDSAAAVITGMSDGIVIPFALACGLAGALVSTNIIAVAGVIVVIAGALSMGFGGYFTAKAELPRFNPSENIRAQTDPTKLKVELSELFSSLGLTGTLKEKAVNELVEDKSKWTEFLKANGETQTISYSHVSRLSAQYVCISYLAGGLIPLVPYMATGNIVLALKLSIALTAGILLSFGIFKGKKNSSGVVKTALMETVVGLLAGAGAYLVGNIFTNAL